MKLASNYAFRSEQANVARLTNVGAKVDAAAGTVELCGITVVADITTGDGCATASAADGFAPIQIDDTSGIQMLDFTAKASASRIDAVVGMSAAPATGWADLATAVRFAPSGSLDMRDGDAYRSDVAQPYGATTFQFRVIAPLGSQVRIVPAELGDESALWGAAELVSSDVPVAARQVIDV